MIKTKPSMRLCQKEEYIGYMIVVVKNISYILIIKKKIIKMKKLYLIYINNVGKDWQGNYLYEFLYSDKI